MTTRPLLLVGSGLSAGLLAWTLRQRRPNQPVRIFERSSSLGGNHTWCFHDADLSAPQRGGIEPLVEHHWSGQSVRFPDLGRSLASGYNCVTSTRFDAVLTPALGDALQLSTPVRALAPDHLVLESGERIEGTVIDARGFRPHPALTIRFQSFLGHEIETAAPHRLATPVIMDATTPQTDGYRFTYLLPFDERRILIEDTGYVDDSRLDRAALAARIEHYVADHDWQVTRLVRTESGVLPIALGGDPTRFWADKHGVPTIGLAGGFFHPTTGYSLPDAVRVAGLIAGLDDLSPASVFAALAAHAQAKWRSQGFFRALNRMLFLAAPPTQRWRVMQRFYRLPEPLIERFYAGALTGSDKLRILMGKPPVPIGAAMSALLSSPAPGGSA